MYGENSYGTILKLGGAKAHNPPPLYLSATYIGTKMYRLNIQVLLILFELVVT